MSVLQKEFVSYAISYYSGGTGMEAFINCNSSSTSIGSIVFYKDGTNPAPQNSISSGLIKLHYPTSRFADIFAILQYEKPLSLKINEQSFIGSIEVGVQSTGEQELTP